MDNLIFNGQFNITYCNMTSDDLASNYGAFTGNGKVALYNSLTLPQAQRTMISQNFPLDQIGRYKNNTVNVFNTCGVYLKSFLTDDIDYTLDHQTLNMANASVETKFAVSSNNIPYASITNTITPLRQYPYCMLQRVEVVPNSNILVASASGGSNFDLYHEIQSDRHITDCSFNNTVVYNESLNEQGIYIITANGNISRLKCTVISGSTYIMDNSNIKIQGFNVDNSLTTCFQKLKISDAFHNTPIVFHIMHCHMTNYDFKEPLDEVKRILLNTIYHQEPAAAAVMLTNSSLWNKLWNNILITITPETGLSAIEVQRIHRVQMFITRAMFNIFSCVREVVNTEINPLNLSYVDTNGHIFFDGDLWLMPVLTLLKPSTAKALIEFRYKQIEQALQLASSIGYDGAKYPYVNDVVGYNNIYWDVLSPLHIFNNALICITVWNYYRMSEIPERDWLTLKGYPIMKNVANFFVAYASNNNINNVLGLGDTVLYNNHALTNYLIITSLKYTIEASYALNVPPDSRWLDLYGSLDYPVFTDSTNFDVIKLHGAYMNDTVHILDNFVIMHPFFNDVFIQKNLRGNDKFTIIKKNMDFYQNKVDIQYTGNAINTFLYASLYAYISQNDESYLNTFYSALEQLFTTNTKGVWHYFNQGVEDSKLLFGNDISLDAFYLLIIMSCVCGIEIKGGYFPDRTTYTPLSFLCDLSAKMPSTWRDIQFYGLGKSSRPYPVTNIAL